MFSFQSLHAQDQEREILPEQINSPYIEIRPFISGDDQTLYFSRSEHPENLNGEKDMQDVWMVKRIGNGWGTPENMGKDINNKSANSLCSISPDGQELLMFNTYRKISGPLARFRKVGNSWGKPEQVNISSYRNYNQYLDFFQSFIEEVLLLAIETEDSHGEQDLYVSFPDGQGNWSQPLNLGSVINTRKSEFAPFLAADGKTLFFSSYGRKGLGGADIYYTHRLDDSWQKWSAPVNLGDPINSRGEETYCSVTDDMKSIYYVSYHHGSETRDIIKSDLPTLQVEEPEPVVTEAEVLQADTPAPAEANEEHGVASENSAVTASIQQKGNTAKTADGHVEQPHPKSLTDKKESKSLHYKAVPSDIAGMQQYMILRNIYFEFNELTIKNDAYDSLLEEIAVFIRQHPETKLKLVGHSDELGTAAGNKKTSKLRAQAVQNYLVKLGITKENILIDYKGEKEPLASNDDDREGRELNRRVEIFLLIPEGS